MSAVRLSLFACLVLAACGDDGGGAPDAKQADAAGATVVMVTCPATPAATVVTTDASFVYNPAATTINQGQVVKFTMSATHNVAPFNGAGAMTDPGLTVNFNQEKCLMFTKTGTFKFLCTPHGFTGTVTVN
jgi:plastocyanin